MYLDTTCSFSPQRLVEIATAHGMPVEATLECIECRTVTDVSALLHQLYQLRARASTFDLALVVVDSIGAVFTPVVSRASAKANAMLVETAALLHELAAVGQCVVVTTNYAYVDRTTHSERPALGVAWASAPHCRLLLSRRSGGGSGARVGTLSERGEIGQQLRRITLVKSAYSPTHSHVNVRLARAGFVNDE